MTPPTERPPVDDWRTQMDRLQAEAVRVLTEAAQLPAPAGYADKPTDMADLIATVLAGVAANLGGTYRLLAGRPGSWEADLVSQLVRGTVGWSDEHLSDYLPAGGQ